MCCFASGLSWRNKVSADGPPLSCFVLKKVSNNLGSIPYRPARGGCGALANIVLHSREETGHSRPSDCRFGTQSFRNVCIHLFCPGFVTHGVSSDNVSVLFYQCMSFSFFVLFLNFFWGGLFRFRKLSLLEEAESFALLALEVRMEAVGEQSLPVCRKAQFFLNPLQRGPSPSGPTQTFLLLLAVCGFHVQYGQNSASSKENHRCDMSFLQG